MEDTGKMGLVGSGISNFLGIKIKSLQIWERMENPGFLGNFWCQKSTRRMRKKVGEETFRDHWKIPEKIPWKIRGGRGRSPSFGDKNFRKLQEI